MKAAALRLLGACLFLSLAACSKSGDPASAEKAAVPPAAAAPQSGTHFVTVIYNPPQDPAAFEKYYWETHVPLVGEKQAEIGFVSAELTRLVGTLDGQPSPFYRQAVLWFDSAEAREKGLASAGFKAVGDDLANFASGGLIALLGEQTSERSPLAQGDQTHFLTVIYQQPADAAAFESYYADTHVPLVGEHAGALKFSRAELTRFSANLDGSTPAAHYRQAKLYFPSEAALKEALGTDGFKAVGDDLGNFATGGLIGLTGHLTSGPTP